MLSAQCNSFVSYRSLDQPITSGETIASRLRLLSIDWFWRGSRHVSRWFWRNDDCTWRVAHCGCSIDRSEQRRHFVCLAFCYVAVVHAGYTQVGASLDMRACNDVGLPRISSLDAHITRIHLLQRRCTLVVEHVLSPLSAR